MKIKQKTSSAAKSRFKITATGKVMRRVQNSRHLRSNKSKRAIRRYHIPVEVTGKIAKKVKQLLGIA